MFDYSHHYLTVEDLIKKKMYTIPVCHRTFSWGKEQISEFQDEMEKRFDENG